MRGISTAYLNIHWVRKLGVNWPVQGSLKELQPTTTDGDFPECPWGYTWNTDVNSWMSFGASKSESDSNFLHCPQLILYCGLKQLRGRLKLLVWLVCFFDQEKVHSFWYEWPFLFSLVWPGAFLQSLGNRGELMLGLGKRSHKNQILATNNNVLQRS